MYPEEKHIPNGCHIQYEVVQSTVHLAIEGNQTLLVATGTDYIGQTKNLNI